MLFPAWRTIVSKNEFAALGEDFAKEEPKRGASINGQFLGSVGASALPPGRPFLLEPGMGYCWCQSALITTHSSRKREAAYRSTCFLVLNGVDRFRKHAHRAFEAFTFGGIHVGREHY